MAPLPEHAEIDDLVLHRWLPADAEELHAAIVANVEHLRDRMAWVAHESLPVSARRELVEGWAQRWAVGEDCSYAIRRNGVAVGSTGLHRRIGPGGVEIGYWVDHRHEGQGIASRASQALTELAFAVPELDRVEIHHDVANLASARIPEKLGFTRHADIVATRDLGPADTGTDGVWRVARDAWRALHR